MTFRLTCLLGILTLLNAARAQLLEESIPLVPGWNAVYLSVDPADGDPDAVFADLPIESVWMWNQQAPPAEFVQDPTRLTPGQPDWLVYLPPGNAAPNPQPLFRILGGRAYLVRLAGNEGQTWTVKGVPRHRVPEWRANRFHLTGFPIHPAGGPTFANYFAASPAHVDQPIFQLDAAGHWVQIEDAATTPIQPKRAYWVFSREASAYEGPIRINWERRGRVDFGQIAVQQTLGFENQSGSAVSLILQQTPSAVPSENQTPLAGPVSLTHFVSNLANQTQGYFEFPQGIKLDLGSGQSNTIRFAVQRENMLSNDPEAVFQSLLTVDDGRGLRFHIPITSRGQNQPANLLQANAHGEAHPNAGLWMGDVTVDAVNEPRNPFAPAIPQPTRTGFQFRVLLHVDARGQTHLLRDALIMATSPEFAASADEPQRFVILTDDSLLEERDSEGNPRFVGSTLRDGTPVGRRISTVNFSFDAPIGMEGTPPNTLTGSTVIPFDHPLNPFVHRYHPDHDNKNREFEPLENPGTESFEIERQLTFEFSAEEPTGLVIAGYGSRLLGGNYRETIRGLHKDALHLSGTFRLARLIDVPELNDGLTPQSAAVPAQAR